MVTPLPIILSRALIASVRAAEWQTIQVPDANKPTGAAWLRAWENHGRFHMGVAIWETPKK